MSPDQSLKSNQSGGPGVGAGGPPVWVFVLLALTFYWGFLYLDAHSGGFHPKVYEPHDSYATVQSLKVQKSPEELAFLGGKQVYTRCAACHQPNGLGSASVGYPPLSGSEWVLADKPNRVIAIVLKGLQGPIEVAGQQFGKVPMTPQGMGLSDKQIADVVTYIRRNTEWNEAHNLPLVTADEVKSVREAIADRTTPWTVEELVQAVPDGQ